MKKLAIYILLCAIAMVFGCTRKEEPLNHEKQTVMEEEEKLEELYRVGLSRYLLETLGLEKYDKQLRDSNMNYIPLAEEEKSEAQKKDKLGLTYIYLCNNIHLERLNERDSMILETELQKGETNAISDEAMEVIVRTFPDVIAQSVIEKPEDKNIETMYENNTDFVEIHAVVFMIGTDCEFDEGGTYVSEEHEVEKQRALQKFANQMETELAGRLEDIPIRIRRTFSLFSEDGNGFLNYD